MTRRRAKAPSQRQLRVGEQIRHILSQQLAHGGLRDPELAEASITVSEVRVSPDFKNATVFVAPFAGPPGEALLPALQRASSFLRQQVGRELALRNTPALRFEADPSFDEAARIDDLLRQPRVRRDLEADQDSDAVEDSDGGEDSDAGEEDDPDAPHGDGEHGGRGDGE